MSDAALKIFISYRRKDTGAHALLLYERLKQRFGEENVFVDVEVLRPGMNWRDEIHARAGSYGVLIALIGSQWLSLQQSAAQQGAVEPVLDVAREEIELALLNSDIHVVPVLVDDATMPLAHQLPRSLRALVEQQAEQVRLTSLDSDVARLIERLERIAPPPPKVTRPEEPPSPEPPSREPPSPSPASHHARVASLMRGTGHVVAVLGSGINKGCEPLLDAENLASDLARRFSYEPRSSRSHLAEVAEYVERTWGKPELYLSLKENLAVEFEPTAVHEFLADLPARLQELGLPRRQQLILTTNYDTALERAFEAADEEFDLLVYIPSSGRFRHLPWKTEGELIGEPNRYHGLPIGDDLELTRTVIVKIHGAVNAEVDHAGGDYVITEDNYIDYLSGTSIEQIVPFQVVQKLRSSHCLFLGYDIRDWNLRVFLMRMWPGRIMAPSWAVDEAADEFAGVLWRDFGAEVVAESLGDYVNALAASLGRDR
jgi:SIR2-like protein/TIR domain-containing protein